MKKTFDSYVISGILTNNDYEIKEIRNLKSLKSTSYTLEIYQSVIESIQNDNLSRIFHLPELSKEHSEFLDIMEFDDQSGNKYIITVYDSLELTQDPQVLQIFAYSKKD